MTRRLGYATLLCAAALAGCAMPPFLQPRQQQAGPPMAYDCEDGLRLTVRWASDAALVTLPEGRMLTLKQQVSGSGFSYAEGPHHLRGKGNEFTWAVDDRIPTRCIAQVR